MSLIAPDSASFDEIPRLHGRALYRRALCLTRSRSDAQDLVQNTYARALARGLEGIPRQRMRSWLLVILKNQFLDSYRARRAHPTCDEQAVLELLAEDPPEPPPWARFSVEDVRRAMGQLSPTLRRTYQLHTFEGLGYALVAARLRIPLRTVGTRLLRARLALRRLLEGGAACPSLAARRRSPSPRALRQAA
jgi:RNA polymerase sigma-70 factor (ECF subfamily)